MKQQRVIETLIKHLQQSLSLAEQALASLSSPPPLVRDRNQEDEKRRIKKVEKVNKYPRIDIYRKDGTLVAANLPMLKAVNAVINDVAPNLTVQKFKDLFNHRLFPGKQPVVATDYEYNNCGLADKEKRFEPVKTKTSDNFTIYTYRGWTEEGNFPTFKTVASKLGYRIVKV